MTDKEPGDVVGVIANKLKIHVATEPEDDNSYDTIGKQDGVTGYTVGLKAGKTHFKFRGETFVFDGYRWFPQIETQQSHQDGKVSLVDPADGFVPPENHPLNRVTLSEFVAMVNDGRLEPTTDPDVTHD